MAKLELFYPCKPLGINQVFGVNPQNYASMGIAGHNGIDFQATHGQKVLAAHNGIVTFAGDDGKGGWGVVIRTNDARDYISTPVYFKSIYWHLMTNIPVKAGQQVKVGDIIGYADNTGYSTGDHLHFGLKPCMPDENWIFDNLEQKNGFNGAIDPMPFFNGWYAEDYAATSTKIADLIKKVAAFLGLVRK